MSSQSQSSPIPPAPPALTVPSTTTQATSTPPSPKGEASMSTVVNSVGALKDQAPKVYHAILQSLATTICREMKTQQDHLKEIQKEYQQ